MKIFILLLVCMHFVSGIGSLTNTTDTANQKSEDININYERPQFITKLTETSEGLQIPLGTTTEEYFKAVKLHQQLTDNDDLEENREINDPSFHSLLNYLRNTISPCKTAYSTPESDQSVNTLQITENTRNQIVFESETNLKLNQISEFVKSEFSDIKTRISKLEENMQRNLKYFETEISYVETEINQNRLERGRENMIQEMRMDRQQNAIHRLENLLEVYKAKLEKDIIKTNKKIVKTNKKVGKNTKNVMKSGPTAASVGSNPLFPMPTTFTYMAGIIEDMVGMIADVAEQER